MKLFKNQLIIFHFLCGKLLIEMLQIRSIYSKMSFKCNCKDVKEDLFECVFLFWCPWDYRIFIFISFKRISFKAKFVKWKWKRIFQLLFTLVIWGEYWTLTFFFSLILILVKGYYRSTLSLSNNMLQTVREMVNRRTILLFYKD